MARVYVNSKCGEHHVKFMCLSKEFCLVSLSEMKPRVLNKYSGIYIICSAEAICLAEGFKALSPSLLYDLNF